MRNRIREEDYYNVLDQEGRRLLGVIQKNAIKMGFLIDDLLAFSRLGKKDLHKTNINMTLLVETVYEDLILNLKYKPVIIINELHPIQGDKPLITQVWMNLLGNAIKYSVHTARPVIVISSEKSNGELIFSVKDNGAGFDMQ